MYMLHIAILQPYLWCTRTPPTLTNSVRKREDVREFQNRSHRGSWFPLAAQNVMTEEMPAIQGDKVMKTEAPHAVG
jgi:hypothetical protein